MAVLVPDEKCVIFFKVVKFVFDVLKTQNANIRDQIGQFKHRVKFYTGIIFIGSGPGLIIESVKENWWHLVVD